MKSKILLAGVAALAVAFSFSSCKKDTRLDGMSDAVSSTGSTPLSGSRAFARGGDSSELVYSLTPLQIKAIKNNFVANYHENYETPGQIDGKPALCGGIITQQATLLSINLTGSGCSPDANSHADYTYLYQVMEMRPVYNTLAYDFSGMYPSSIGSYPSTIPTPDTDAEMCQSNNPGGILNPCPHYLTFTRTFSTLRSTYNSASYFNFDISATCTEPGSPTTLESSTSSPLDAPVSYYGTIPATVYVFNTSNSTTHQFSVYDRCTVLLCFVYHYLCPTTTTFKYRIVGTPTWNVTNSVPSTIGAPAGNYEYEAQHHYSGGVNSLVSTGFFTVS